MDEMPPKVRELFGRLTDAETELLEAQRAIAVDPIADVELAMFATRLRVILMLLAEAKIFLEYELPAFSDPDRVQEVMELVADVRRRLLGK